jgi:O-acetylhomoserine/O-acetylserine sulfhydrylase-like pyridoxal-dependent enzyme
MTKPGFNTLALHSGVEASFIPSLSVPLFQTVAYPFDNAQQAADIFSYQAEGHSYGRVDNPTCFVLEKRVAALEGAEAGLSTSTGMAAIFMTAIHLAQAGDEIVCSNRVYGGTFQQFANTLRRLGITVKMVEEPRHLTAWTKAITPRTRFLYIETPSNPNLTVLDIEALAKLAHAHDLPLVVDNTVATPALQQPLKWGADIVVHSATKYLCGNSTSLGGVIVGRKDLMTAIRQEHYRNIGPSLAPFNAWMILLGLETLSLRMERHSRNALKVAQFLNEHPQVKSVSYPGLPNDPQHELAKKQMSDFSGLLMFEVDGGFERARQVMDNVELCKRVGHLGDSRTILLHPASTTHQQLTEEERRNAGIAEGMIRLSVGLENVEDVITDLDQALKAAGAAHRVSFNMRKVA